MPHNLRIEFASLRAAGPHLRSAAHAERYVSDENRQ